MAKKTEIVTHVTGLVPGSRPNQNTSVMGDVEEARRIADKSLEVVELFSQAVIAGDLERAHEFCAQELQAWMTVKRLAEELARADEEFGGKAIEYSPERITWIYASELSRNENNKEGQWPKDTPKQNKRSFVGGWWTSLKTPEGKSFGRSVFFWITQEPAGYRIAKFRQSPP